MFDKVKTWLGIEGVKVELECSEFFSMKNGILKGHVKLSSLSNQTIIGISLKFIEKYKRGRGEHKLIDEYTLGTLDIIEKLEIKAEEQVYIPFELAFQKLQSEMDAWEEKNILTKGIVGAAKLMKGVESVYRLDVSVQVKGTALHPVNSKVLKPE